MSRRPPEPPEACSPERAPTTTQPAARPFHESTPAHSKTPASDEGRPRKNVSSSGRSRTLRRLVMIGVPLAALLAIYLIIQLVLDQPSTAREQWRAIVRQ